MQIPYLPVRGRKVLRFMGGSIGPRMEICGISGLPIIMVPRLQKKQWLFEKEATGMESSKMYYTSRYRYRTYQCGGRKVPRFMGGSRGPRMEICGNSGLPLLMVPCLHQSNGHMKRKLRAWRVQKCMTLVSVDTVLTSAGPQSTPFHGG